MIAFEVNDMTCGHCVRAITEAVHCADNGARVQVDLAAHRVQIEPVAAQASTLLDAIQQAGLPALSPRLVLELVLMALLFASLVSSAMAVRFYNHAGLI